MANIVTTGTAFPGTTVNLNSNSISIAVGDSLAVSAGISNTIFLGASTALSVGAKISLTLGPSSNYSWGPVLNAGYGPSWSWSGTNNTIYDVTSRWGVLNNTYNGGISPESYAARWSEEAQGRKITMAVLAMYVATVGMALVGIEEPPFTMTGSSSPLVPATGVTTTNERQDLITLIADPLAVILMTLGQYYLVKKLWNWRNFKPVANLGLAANGLTSFVYTNPDLPADSPVASFLMQPGTETAPGTCVPGATYIPYVSDEQPVISLTSSMFPATTGTSSVTIKPSSVIISSSAANAGPQLSFNASLKTITMTNNVADDNTSGTISITPEQTLLSRYSGDVLLQTGMVPSQTLLSLSSKSGVRLIGASQISSGLMLNSNGVIIGTKAASAKFSSSSITLGGPTGIVIEAAKVTIGGALVVTGPALSAALSSAITQAQTEIATQISTANAALQAQLAANEVTIKELQAAVSALSVRQGPAVTNVASMDDAYGAMSPTSPK